MFASLARDLRFASGLFRTLGRVRGIHPASPRRICDDLEAAAARWNDREALRFEGRSLTYAGMEALANRFARWALEAGLKPGDRVALFLPNRIEYLPAWYGLSKVGVVSALINNQLTGQALAHCLTLAGAHEVIVDAETSPALQDILGDLEHTPRLWSLDAPLPGEGDLTTDLAGRSADPPPAAVRDGLKAGDTALLIYTSGTTGLPKAARVTHVRVQLYMRGFAGSTGARSDDRIYVALPLYHATGGLCGMGAALLNGACVVLKRRFSATQFWEDIRREGCTQFVYIGELCRYLANQPPHPDERAHKLRLAFGNGLRPDVWDKVTGRFGVPRVLEFYGSTEGNVSFFNFDGRPGAIGRLPALLRRRFNGRIVRFDYEAEAPLRGPDGYCQEAAPGEAGECLGRIDSSDPRADYTGYLDKAASEKKVLRDVFTPGDAWFRTGDLLRQDEDGYVFFVDRVGDTFRWKGENVSTAEVALRLQAVPGVIEANVYGVEVPRADGRAGMAALVTGEDFDLGILAARIAADLPEYARPAFLRLQPEMAVTGTFKQRKVELVAEGFDPAKVAAPLFHRAADGGYRPLDTAVYGEIVNGRIRI
jgi:fatty-acyl-CoA synthase